MKNPNKKDRLILIAPICDPYGEVLYECFAIVGQNSLWPTKGSKRWRNRYITVTPPLKDRICNATPNLDIDIFWAVLQSPDMSRKRWQWYFNGTELFDDEETAIEMARTA